MYIRETIKYKRRTDFKKKIPLSGASMGRNPWTE
jgi:hypothetical protein